MCDVSQENLPRHQDRTRRAQFFHLLLSYIDWTLVPLDSTDTKYFRVDKKLASQLATTTRFAPSFVENGGGIRSHTGHAAAQIHPPKVPAESFYGLRDSCCISEYLQ